MTKKADQPRKMSDIMKEMTERLFRNPDVAHSSEAFHVALFFANVAWNGCVGLVHDRESYRNVWETIEANNPKLWNELKSNDIDAMIDELVQYRSPASPTTSDGFSLAVAPRKGRYVEWLPPVSPGMDAKWEMQLYGLVRTGQPEKAMRFLKKTRGCHGGMQR